MGTVSFIEAGEYTCYIRGVRNYTVEEESTHLPGDITGDGKINNRDVARLMQYLAGWDVEIF